MRISQIYSDSERSERGANQPYATEGEAPTIIRKYLGEVFSNPVRVHGHPPTQRKSPLAIFAFPLFTDSVAAAGERP